VVGSNGLEGGLVQHLSLKQCGSSCARTKYDLKHLILFTAMKLKTGFKNPRRHLKIVSLWKKVPKMLICVFTILFRKVYKIGCFKKYNLNKKQTKI
jgi:hypothetical protein